jgi:3',5'-cyclic AMP phosphodiesterase CpdA
VWVLWIAAATQPGGAIAQDVLRFVQITDTHLGDRDHLERTRSLVAMINRLPLSIDFVVHTGDIFADGVPSGARAQLASVFASLTPPIYFLPGNHDIPSTDLAGGAAVFRREVGPLVHRAEHRGVVLVFAYTEPMATGTALPGYDPYVEIESALSGAGGKPVLFFHHRPAAEDFYNNFVHPGWEPAGRTRLEDLLRRHPVKAVVTGHFHRDELQWVGDVPVFTAPPVASYWGRQASVRIYEYSGGRLSYRSVYLGE